MWRAGRSLAPCVERPFTPAASRALPLGFGRQAIPISALRAQPLAIIRSLEPARGNHGLVGMIEAGVAPLRRRRPAGCIQEARIVAIPHLMDSYRKRIHPDAMHGLLLVASPLAAHLKITSGDRRAYRPLDSYSTGASSASHGLEPAFDVALDARNRIEFAGIEIGI